MKILLTETRIAALREQITDLDSLIAFFEKMPDGQWYVNLFSEYISPGVYKHCAVGFLGGVLADLRIKQLIQKILPVTSQFDFWEGKYPIEMVDANNGGTSIHYKDRATGKYKKRLESLVDFSLETPKQRVLNYLNNIKRLRNLESTLKHMDEEQIQFIEDLVEETLIKTEGEVTDDSIVT